MGLLCLPKSRSDRYIDRKIIIFSLGYILSYTTIFDGWAIHTPFTYYLYSGYIYIHMSNARVVKEINWYKMHQLHKLLKLHGWQYRLFIISLICLTSSKHNITLEWKVLDTRCFDSKLNNIDKSCSFKNNTTFFRAQDVFSMEIIQYTLSRNQNWSKSVLIIMNAVKWCGTLIEEI